MESNQLAMDVERNEGEDERIELSEEEMQTVAGASPGRITIN
jgi:hypothetical protein